MRVYSVFFPGGRLGNSFSEPETEVGLKETVTSLPRDANVGFMPLTERIISTFAETRSSNVNLMKSFAVNLQEPSLSLGNRILIRSTECI